MSEALFYNRDTNISGVAVPSELSDLSLTPSYGSKVEFQGLNHKYVTDNFYYNLIPLSVNSLGAKFSLKYEVNETNAQKLVAFFENQSGYLPIKFAPDNSGIYKGISGFCDNYGVNFVNNQHFEVAAGIVVDRAPTLLNWKNGNFANVPFQNWDRSVSYKKYDVAYFGLNSDDTINDNKLENFYYCSGDHTSSDANSPTGATSLWSQKFFFEPDIGTQNDVKIKADVVHYKNSFAQHLKTNKNIATFDMSYTYSNISDHQLKSMLHFLENKGGYRRFEHQIPSVYNRPKVYYCPSWNHTWNYFNSNTLTVDLVEDPLGVLPRALQGTALNTAAQAYIDEVETNDTYQFSPHQKIAISDFFSDLDAEGLSSKIKRMWLVGFSKAAALRDVMNPDPVNATWSGAGPANYTHGSGFAYFNDDAGVAMNENLAGLGLTTDDCGAFVAGTDMGNGGMGYINTYTEGTPNKMFQLKQNATAVEGVYPVAFRANYNPNLEALVDGVGRQNGVFVGYRPNSSKAGLTRIYGGKVAQTWYENKAYHSDQPANNINIWSENTEGYVSTAGITEGLTTDQAEKLGGIIYDLCVGIGHTDLEYTTQ